MEYNQPKPGESNAFFDLGEFYLKRGLAHINPILEVRCGAMTPPARKLLAFWHHHICVLRAMESKQALRDQIRKCRAGECPATGIGKGIDFSSKPWVEPKKEASELSDAAEGGEGGAEKPADRREAETEAKTGQAEDQSLVEPVNDK